MDNRTLLQVSSRREKALSSETPYKLEVGNEFILSPNLYSNVTRERQKQFLSETERSKCSRVS